MGETKFKPIMVFHLVLMLVVLLLSIFSAFQVLGFAQSVEGESYDGAAMGVSLYGVYKLLTAVALCSGIIYLVRGYGKKAAGYYKAFLFLLVIATAANALTILLIVLGSFSPVALIGLVAHIAKIAALLALVFKKDLGKRNTWIVFLVVVAMDVLIGCLSSGPQLVVYRIIGLVSRLAMDGTIALAIRGKYEDKASRGTE